MYCPYFSVIDICWYVSLAGTAIFFLTTILLYSLSKLGVTSIGNVALPTLVQTTFLIGKGFALLSTIFLILMLSSLGCPCS